MAKIYKTALGKQIDVDHLALSNENTIAVGNMRVNSRGDELGPGGKIVKTRDQIMKEYYALNTPVAVDPVISQGQPTTQVKSRQVEQVSADPIVFNPASGLDEDEPVVPDRQVHYIDTGSATPEKAADIINTVVAAFKDVSTSTEVPTEIRGSLASSVAKTATVNQVEKLPPKKASGVQRF